MMWWLLGILPLLTYVTWWRTPRDSKIGGAIFVVALACILGGLEDAPDVTSGGHIAMAIVFTGLAVAAAGIVEILATQEDEGIYKYRNRKRLEREKAAKEWKEWKVTKRATLAHDHQGPVKIVLLTPEGTESRTIGYGDPYEDREGFEKVEHEALKIAATYNDEMVDR